MKRRRPRTALEEVEAARLEPEFKHRERQLACPGCRYVFTQGFTDCTKLAARRTPDGAPPRADVLGGGTITVCSRCDRILRLAPDGSSLRALDEVEQLLLSDADRAAVGFIRELYRDTIRRLS